jgi:hypothetical protein
MNNLFDKLIEQFKGGSGSGSGSGSGGSRSGSRTSGGNSGFRGSNYGGSSRTSGSRNSTGSYKGSGSFGSNPKSYGQFNSNNSSFGKPGPLNLSNLSNLSNSSNITKNVVNNTKLGSMLNKSLGTNNLSKSNPNPNIYNINDVSNGFKGYKNRYSGWKNQYYTNRNWKYNSGYWNGGDWFDGYWYLNPYNNWNYYMYPYWNLSYPYLYNQAQSDQSDQPDQSDQSEQINSSEFNKFILDQLVKVKILELEKDKIGTESESVLEKEQKYKEIIKFLLEQLDLNNSGEQKLDKEIVDNIKSKLSNNLEKYTLIKPEQSTNSNLSSSTIIPFTVFIVLLILILKKN